MMNYTTCWLTVNRACNLRCKWCYAKSTEYNRDDNMGIINAKQIVDICSDLSINSIILIGGEPTLYPQLFDIIKYIKSKNMHCGIVTNGLKFAEEGFVESIKDVGISSVSVSVKGENREAFKKITGCDLYSQTLSAITTCINHGLTVNASMVLTDENINTFMEGISTLVDLGVRGFHLSFCYEFNTTGQYNYLDNHSPKYLIQQFERSYSKLDELTNHRFNLSQGYPLCLWDKNILDMMNKKGQISTVCQLLGKSGLIFDPCGYLLPCNAMPGIKLGKLNSDFCDANELVNYIENDDFKHVYEKLCSLPDPSCMDCPDLINCGGGCVCQWTNYSFNQLMRS